MLENLNLTIADREFVTIVGASGCGKTTFLRMLLGVEQPTRGQLLIDGKPVPAEPGPDRGIVFQRYSLFPHLTVIENLLLGLEFSGSRLLGQSVRRQARAALESARRCSTRSVSTRRATSIRRSSPAACSSACRSRSRSFCEPKILLLDEPFGALDPGITADMHEIILRLWHAIA